MANGGCGGPPYRSSRKRLVLVVKEDRFPLLHHAPGKALSRLRINRQRIAAEKIVSRLFDLNRATVQHSDNEIA
jgi:hypothetical protein